MIEIYEKGYRNQHITGLSPEEETSFFQLFWTKFDDFKEWRKHLQSSWKEYAAVNMF